MHCDIPDFYECCERKARKEHRCCECDAPILRGEKYVIASGKWSGEISTFRQHVLCADACRFIRNSMNDAECICFGGLKEWWHEARFCFANSDREHPKWKAFRGMMAGILRRERAASRTQILEPTP